MLGQSMRVLRGQLRVLQAHQDKHGFDKDIANSIASIGRAATGLAAELRKLEVHDQRLVDSLTSEERDRLVVSYLRDLAPDRRQEVRRLLDDLDQAEMLLS